MKLPHGKTGRDAGYSKAVGLFQDQKSLRERNRPAPRLEQVRNPLLVLSNSQGTDTDKMSVRLFHVPVAAASHSTHAIIFSPEHQFRQEIVHRGCHVIPR